MDITEIEFYTLAGWTASKVQQQIEIDVRMNMYDEPKDLTNKKFKITIEEMER